VAEDQLSPRDDGTVILQTRPQKALAGGNLDVEIVDKETIHQTPASLDQRQESKIRRLRKVAK